MSDEFDDDALEFLGIIEGAFGENAVEAEEPDVKASTPVEDAALNVLLEHAEEIDEAAEAIAGAVEEALQDSPSLPEPVDPFDTPEMKAINTQVSELITQIDEFDDKLAEIKPIKDGIEEAKKRYLEEAQRKIAEFERSIMKLEADRRRIERDRRDADDKKSRLLADMDHALEAHKAEQLLQEARRKWQDIIEKNDWLWASLIREYQMRGIEFIASAVDRDLGGVALLDDMGLGKTLQAVAARDLMQSHELFSQRCAERLSTWDETQNWCSSVLWICPDSIKETTQAELAKWSNHPVMVLPTDQNIRGHVAKMAHASGMTLIVGYAQVRDRMERPVTPELFEVEWPIVVADEVQAARKYESATFINVQKLAKKSAFFIPMSGTPVENKAIEFWVTLNLITQKGRREGEFYSPERFHRMYLFQNGTYQYGGFQALMSTVKDMVLRREKKDVALELPEKTHHLHAFHMNREQRDLYDKMRTQLYLALEEGKDFVEGTNFLALLTRLRQIALLPAGIKIPQPDGPDLRLDSYSSAKLDKAMELLTAMSENDKKCLVFCCFNEPLWDLERRVAEAELTWVDKAGNTRQALTASITGDTKSDDRAHIVARFNDPEDDLRFVVANIMAGGTGYNMQGACDQEIFLDLYWNPSKNRQAEDRCHRLGQTNPVDIHILQEYDCVDLFIADILENKSGMIDSMMGRKELRSALDRGLI